MRQILLFTSFITVLAFFSPISYAASPDISRFQSTPFYQKMDEASKSSGAKGITRILKDDIKTAEDMAITADWLRDNSALYKLFHKDLNGYNSLYSLMYSDVMKHLSEEAKQVDENDGAQSLSETALVALYSFEAIATEDALRCKDLSVVSNVIDMVRPRYQAFIPVISTLSEDKMRTIWDISQKYAASVRDRPPNKEICSTGMAAINAALANPQTTTEKKDDPNSINGKVNVIKAPEGFNYQPEYLNDQEWSAKLRDMPKFEEIWSIRYHNSIQKR